MISHILVYDKSYQLLTYSLTGNFLRKAVSLAKSNKTKHFNRPYHATHNSTTILATETMNQVSGTKTKASCG